MFGKSKPNSSATSTDSTAKGSVTKGDEKALAKSLDTYANVPDNEAQILKAQTEVIDAKATFFTLYRYANAFDKFLLLNAVFWAIVSGAALPMFTLVVGAITNNFRDLVVDSEPPGNFQHIVNHNCLYFVYIGIGIMGSAFLQAFLFNNRGQVIAGRWRKAYLSAAIRQNIGYFDYLGAGSVSTRITNDTASVQAAISDKVGQILKAAATFVAGFVIALTQQWRLALIGLSAIVYFMLVVASNGALFGKFVGISMGVYAKGSNVAEESFSAARNSIALGAQHSLAAKFDVFLEKCRKTMSRGGIHMSLMIACMWSTLGFLYALLIWEGSRMIARGDATVGHVITVMISTLLSMFNLGAIAPQIRSLVSGLAAAKNLNEIIDRVPVIDSANEEGTTLEHVQGAIALHNVMFRYPSRPDVLVLPDMSLEIPAGETVALVGASGSGKSTIIGLLERFYKPLSGSITLDGVNIDDFNLRWLRQQIGLVSQEPTLFAASIFDNICYGLIGTEYEHADVEKQRELVIDACKQANAWDFIQTLNEGLETNVGDRGFLLSGGQKQRIAIARAIVSNPKILLLDEATSALDTKSEGIVQEALDRAAKDRTTIVIAHRLSTIKNANKIVVMASGVIQEQGTHKDLIAANGHYAKLVQMQQVNLDGQVAETGLQKQEDAFVEEDDTFVPPPIPGMEQKKPGLLDVVALLWRLNKKEQPIIIMAAVLSVFIGYGQIAYSMLIGKSVESIMVNPSEYHHMRHEINMTTGFFFMVGMIQLIGGFILMRSLTSSSEHLLHNVRYALFKQIMRMDISFFDHEKNSAGALVAILARDGKAIEGLGGATIGQILQCCVMIFGGVITGIVFNWRLGLVGMACVPVIIVTGWLRLKILGRLEERNDGVFEKSGSLASSFTNAVRTIQSLTREQQVCGEYDNLIDKQVSESLIPTFGAAAVFGISEGTLPWVLALIWWYGSTLLRTHKISVFHYYVVFLGTIVGANSAVQFFNFAPDLGKAKAASANVLRMLQAKPLIDIESTEGLVVDNVEGNIEFKNVHFRYPTRPQVPVLRGVSFTIKAGQSAALVGASGCGKSTSIGLVERFYDPDSGDVCLDGVNLKDYNINSLRGHIALVQQEPTLYSGTIKDNILLGWVGNPEEVTQDMVENACNQANIHQFIMSLPDGYDTDVGGKGVLLSGGQKQRIAIARALIRNPPILLLDEATSALDAESEKVVQAALDNASKGRTILSIAHRLSTIQNCDIIYVFDKGKIVEQGTHHQLLELNGRYAELVRLQSLAS